MFIDFSLSTRIYDLIRYFLSEPTPLPLTFQNKNKLGGTHEEIFALGMQWRHYLYFENNTGNHSSTW